MLFRSSPKSIEYLTQDDLELILNIFGFLDYLEIPKFSSSTKSLTSGKGNSFNTLVGPNDIIEDIIYDKTIGHLLLENKLRNKKLEDFAFYGKLFSINESKEDDIRNKLSKISIPIATSKSAVEILYDTYNISKYDFSLDELKDQILKIVTDHSAKKLALDYIKWYFKETESMKITAKVRWIQDNLKELKAKIKDVELEMLDIRKSIVNGGKIFSDQDPTEMKSIEISYLGVKHEYTPKIEIQKTYCGDATDLISRAKQRIS